VYDLDRPYIMQGCSVERRLGLYTVPHLQIESAFRGIMEGATDTSGRDLAYSIASVGSEAHGGGKIGKWEIDLSLLPPLRMVGATTIAFQ
jgi:hypothetical protein